MKKRKSCFIENNMLFNFIVNQNVIPVYLNIGFEFGKRGKVTNGLIQENYINFRLSLSLNDKWFRKLEIF